GGLGRRGIRSRGGTIKRSEEHGGQCEGSGPNERTGDGHNDALQGKRSVVEDVTASLRRQRSSGTPADFPATWPPRFCGANVRATSPVQERGGPTTPPRKRFKNPTFKELGRA